jgi:lysophospholipase L1-like esterase
LIPKPPEHEKPLTAKADLEAIRSLLKKPAGITWLFAGDSITLGGHFTRGGRSYPEHFQERIRWEMKRFDDAVINTAFNGATTDQLSAVLDERVLRHHPQVVFIMIGSNDSRRGEKWLPRFRDWLDLLVGRIRAAGAIPVLQTANHAVSNRDPALLRDETLYMQAVRDCAAANRIFLIDHWSAWENFHADPQSQFSWMGDAIHPNARGHLQLALDIFRAIGLYDSSSKVVRLGGEGSDAP